MATLEQLVLDGLALNDVATYRLQMFDPGVPPKRYEWAIGADADGAALVRDPKHDNREVKIRLRINPQSTMDAALAAIGTFAAKLEEAEKQPDGLDMTWTPANSTKTLTFKVFSGEITGIPIELSGDTAGWFQRSPVLEATLYCHPFMYGSEVTGSATSSATPFVTLTVASVPGDVPAEGRLIVTDAATQARRYVEWGLEQRYYDAATSLLVDSDNMSTSGTAGSQTTRSGAYDPNATGNNVIRASLWKAPVAVAATGNLGHVGTFRVKARVYGAGTGNIYARLAWQDGDGQFRSNPFVQLGIVNLFVEVDLGIISIPTKELGTQRWSGRVEAYSETPADTIDVDYLVLVPAGEGYGKARGIGQITATSVNGYDDFATLAAAAALNTRVAPSGGTWATSGVASDFIGTSSPTQMTGRTTSSDASRRFAILGSTNYTDTQTEVFAQLQFSSALAGVTSGAIARWVDSSNYLYASFSTAGFRIEQIVAGVTTTLRSVGGWYSPNVWWGIRLTAYASGAIIAELRYGNGAVTPSLVIRAYSSAVATGGALATGKPGFFDQNNNSSASTRIYDYFSVAAPSAEPLVINSTRAMEVRSESALRADSTNTYWGPVPAYRGSRFFVPPAGDENRTSRVLVKAHRTDIETGDATNVTDNLTAQINYTPRYLAVPR